MKTQIEQHRKLLIKFYEDNKFDNIDACLSELENGYELYPDLADEDYLMLINEYRLQLDLQVNT